MGSAYVRPLTCTPRRHRGHTSTRGPASVGGLGPRCSGTESGSLVSGRRVPTFTPVRRGFRASEVTTPPSPREGPVPSGAPSSSPFPRQSACARVRASTAGTATEGSPAIGPSLQCVCVD